MKKRILTLLLILLMLCPPISSVSAVSNQETIWNYFKAKGFSDAGIAGIMGNLEAESGYIPNNVQEFINNRLGKSDAEFTAAVDSGEISRDYFVNTAFGYGLAQWTYYTRKAGLYDMAKSRGVSIGDMTLQLDYMYQEIGQYGSLRSYLTKADDVADACLEFHNVYEGSTDGPSAIAGRISMAQRAYDQYAGSMTAPTPGVTPSPSPSPAVAGFTDVPAKSWYTKAVKWAVKNDVTQGTSDTTFSPGANCTRAQVVSFLWRAAGRPEPTLTEHPFTDVKAKAYYYNAMLWAYENGITAGTSKTKFSPNATVTRAQVVTFLWRMADGPLAETEENPFDDVGAKAFYYRAVLWAVEQDITAGTSKTQFSPEQTCTRAQTVTLLYRAMKDY